MYVSLYSDVYVCVLVLRQRRGRAAAYISSHIWGLKLLIDEALSYSTCIRVGERNGGVELQQLLATHIWGLKLYIDEALSYSYMRP
jgi:hypothetical protein